MKLTAENIEEMVRQAEHEVSVLQIKY